MTSMPDITVPYEFSKDELALISELKNRPDFDHDIWSSDELLNLRKNIRKYYREVQKGKCAFCKAPLSLQSARNCDIEHLIHKSGNVNFMFEPKNLCVLCADCNEIKRAQEIIGEIPKVVKGKTVKYPGVSERFLIYHPHYDTWDRHIKKFNKIYVDRTKKGSYTIHICKLNRFFHEFDIDEVYVNEADLTELMSKYLNENDALKKNITLNNIRSLLNNF
ncbi:MULTISPECIES: HNH endonuclease [Enterobacter]|jgi:hypothetical protein|uniref:HNH endonuclease n=1 Tax=Enterobacter TaxID=547 RepID=UPI0012DA17D2|nr:MULTISPECIES: hypothetical protein [Enterobacter]MCS3488344.1 hypothetical protein [Enterobacter sp. SLBN-59]